MLMAALSRFLTLPLLGVQISAAPSAKGGGVSEPTHGNRIPKLIWSFWHSEALVPGVVHLAKATWKHFAPDYQLRLLNDQSFKEYLTAGARDVSPDSFVTLSAFTDWLRLSLLASYGGIWIDSTLLLTAPVDTLLNQTARLSGLHLEAALFESYFLAARPEEDIVQRWRDEMLRIGTMTEKDYDVHLTQLKTRGIEPLNGHMSECDWRDRSPVHEVAHWILHRAVAAVNFFVGYTSFYLHPCGQYYWMWYYRVCVAFNSVVVSADGSDITQLAAPMGIHMFDSDRTLNRIAVSFGWDTTQIVRFLISRSSEDFQLAPIRGIKLRSKERNLLTELSFCETGSIICRLQALVGDRFFEERASPSLETAVEL
ncbi:RBCMT [Symbiodinium sp. CCMP2456]|nr:RBCMT [Symbiodinium sp. CCMP2456]